MPTSSADIRQYPANRAIRLHNLNCIYCGRLFDDTAPTKEHVVGRNFVPRGCLDGQWNLIANACERCNRDKADLEDDISAISMLADLTGQFAVDDPRLKAHAARKAANARSRRSGKVVADSREHIQIAQSFGGADFTFSFTSPPQVEDDRIFRLAHYHFRAFFFLITYRETTRTGGFVQGGFYPLLTARRADWGNPRLRWFMDKVRDWDLRMHAIGADTFFKLIIRRCPQGREVWAWAVEWNHSMRVVGFAGREDAVTDVAADAPELAFDVVHEGPAEWVRMRTDVPLPAEEDDLFSVAIELEAADAGASDA